MGFIKSILIGVLSRVLEKFMRDLYEEYQHSATQEREMKRAGEYNKKIAKRYEKAKKRKKKIDHAMDLLNGRVD